MESEILRQEVVFQAVLRARVRARANYARPRRKISSLCVARGVDISRGDGAVVDIYWGPIVSLVVTTGKRDGCRRAGTVVPSAPRATL